MRPGFPMWSIVRFSGMHNCRSKAQDRAYRYGKSERDLIEREETEWPRGEYSGVGKCQLTVVSAVFGS